MSSPVMTGYGPLVVDLARALGLGEEMRIRGFTLEVHMDRLVTVRAELVSSEDQIEEVVKVLKKHNAEFGDE